VLAVPAEWIKGKDQIQGAGEAAILRNDPFNIFVDPHVLYN